MNQRNCWLFADNNKPPPPLHSSQVNSISKAKCYIGLLHRLVAYIGVCDIQNASKPPSNLYLISPHFESNAAKLQTFLFKHYQQGSKWGGFWICASAPVDHIKLALHSSVRLPAAFYGPVSAGKTTNLDNNNWMPAYQEYRVYPTRKYIVMTLHLRKRIASAKPI